VAEDAGIGTAVGITASASDDDATTNAISYTLDDSAGGLFAIDANSGVVTVAAALDYETATSHSVTVRATSADGSFSTENFTIDVTDVNESGIGAISDTDGNTDTVLENSAVGTAVGVTAFADDPDGTDTVSYSLDDSASGRFAINSSTGEVTLAGGLDREAAGSYDITVRATSSDTSFTTEIFTIAIGDVDEYDVTAPADGDATTDAVDENAANGTTVGITANATDDDATTNAVTYSLFDDAGGRFAIHSSTGVVTVADGTLLNREAAASHDITIRATSADGSTADTVYTITVNDVDEFDVSAPSDTDATDDAVDENAANGTTVGITAGATDDDATTNAVTYTLFNDAGGRFAINGSSGVVTVADGTLLNREAAASHDITVRATSADGSTADTVFTIAVNDLDEFDVGAVTDSNATANSVAEDAGIGTAVPLTASATDDDATTNTITYTLDDSAGGLFAIDGNSGVVTVAAALDYETATSHSVTVRAISADGSFSTENFAIDVTDVNESGVGAISDTDGNTDTVLENSGVGTSVGVTAFAEDPDGTDSVSYSLDDNAGGRFAINSSTGEVTVAGGIDREAAASYDITVRATSSDTSFTTQTFTIAVGDVDEYDVSAPSDSDGTSDAVAENAANGTTVGITAAATDDDATSNAITYSLADDAGGRFTIDRSTGVITVKDGSLLDYEAATSHFIVVRAASSDGSSSLTEMTIVVLDILESPPSAERDLLNSPPEDSSETGGETPAEENEPVESEQDEPDEPAEDITEEEQSESADDQQQPAAPPPESTPSGSNQADAQNVAASEATASTMVEVATVSDRSINEADTTMHENRRVSLEDTFSVETWYVRDSFVNLEMHTEVLNAGPLAAPRWDLYWETLAQPNEDSHQEGRSVEVVVGTAAVVTTAASLTYALWSIRGASLAASMVSSLPVWAMIDPLPIVDSNANAALAKSKRLDDETLEEIARRGATSKKD
jgi:hypothetical protein